MSQRFVAFAAVLIAGVVAVCRAGAGFAAPPEFVLSAKPVGRVEAVHTYEVTFPQVKATEWVAFAAAAPELPSQQTVSTKLSPSGKSGTELSDLKRPIVWTRVAAAGDKQQTHFKYAVTYQATLMERRLTALPKGKQPPKVTPLTDHEKKWYLAATETFYDYNDRPFQDWLDKHKLRIKAGEAEVAFARRAFLVIFDTCTYEARQDNDRSAAAVCQAGKSDCGGLSVLFVAAMRANGIAARSLVGNWAESSKPGQMVGDIPFNQQHVRAEFFVAGVGWIPADPSTGIFHFKGKREAMLQQCFGYDAGNFLVKQIDYDLVFDGGRGVGEQTVTWAWCSAWPVGPGDQSDQTLKDDWKVRKVPGLKAK